MPGLIVEDATAEPGPGQMRRSEFLAQLRTDVCRTAEEALAGTIWSAMGCPWVDHWFGYYADRDSQSIERAIHRYAPESAVVTSARDYIPIISSRVRRAIATWATTGEVTGVPEGVSSESPGATPEGGGLLAGMISAGSRFARSIFFKGRSGGGREPPDPAAIQSRLEGGRPLDSGVKSHMESAFGADFSSVRVHTDARAADLSEGLQARAFTIGRDIAFGAQEYQPGTLVGDALIAHELAHVVQQDGGSRSESRQKGAEEAGSYEEEADRSAAGAVMSLRGGAKGVLHPLVRNALPRLRSGLRLQRCSGEPERAGPPAPVPAPAPPPAPTFERYRELFNNLWNSPPFNAMTSADSEYDYTLSSRGPRTRRSRAIFERIYTTDSAMANAYDADTGGIREPINSYVGPEGLNLIGSPRLTALHAAFTRFTPPVGAAQYPAFRTAIQAAANNLDDRDRAAVNLSNDWQRLINSYGRTEVERAEIRSIITPPITPAAAPAATTAATPAERLRDFIDSWYPDIYYDADGVETWYTSGATVRYVGGAQNFAVGASSFVENPGQALYVKAQIFRRGQASALRTSPVTLFPPNQTSMPTMAMPINAPATVPRAGDVLEFRVQLLSADRTTVLKTETETITVRRELIYTQAAAERAADADEKYLNDKSPRGLRRGFLGKMKAKKGVAANVAEAIIAGLITLRPLTRRHDSSSYVQSQTGSADPAQTGYFAGTSYANSFVAVAGAAGFSLGAGDIVVNRTSDVPSHTKVDDDIIIMLVVHEAVHAMDVRPNAATDLERYKTEFRAYWMDGRFGPPFSGGCPSPPDGCLSTAYDPNMPPPGPKSPRARAIFDLLYGDVTYGFVQTDYDENLGGFREAVDRYLVPDGINLIASIRLEDLRALIAGGVGANYAAFKASVEAYMGIGPPPPNGALTPLEKDEIVHNQAWRNLVEASITNITQQNDIKSVLGIPT